MSNMRPKTPNLLKSNIEALYFIFTNDLALTSSTLDLSKFPMFWSLIEIEKENKNIPNKHNHPCYSKKEIQFLYLSRTIFNRSGF